MKLFIEHSIDEILKKVNCNEISLEQIEEECVSLSIQYEKYKAWKCFSEEKFKKCYNEAKKRFTLGNIRKLEGIPIGVKDVINTEEYPTQMGSVIWEDFQAGNDARIIHNIKYSGGIIAGKTVTAEFAVHTLNETLNPYDVSKTPGTSSSGSAVAVSLGIVPVALATQTAGSIIRPASFCGIYGFKPSFGLIPRTGILKTTDSLDTVGYLTANLKNLRTMFKIITVKGPNYPFSFRALNDTIRQNRIDRNWKIAFVKTYTWNEADDYVKDEINNFYQILKKDNEIDTEELEIDDIIFNAHYIHAEIYDKSLSYYFANEHNDKKHVSNVMNKMIEHGEKISTENYLEALEKQNSMCKKMDNLMQNYDAIISMSTASVAPNRGVFEKDDPSLIWTLLHLPTVNVPLFYDKESGLPFGIQISSRKYNDYLLLNLLDYLSEKKYIPQHSKIINNI